MKRKSSMLKNLTNRFVSWPLPPLGIMSVSFARRKAVMVAKFPTPIPDSKISSKKWTQRRFSFRCTGGKMTRFWRRSSINLLKESRRTKEIISKREKPHCKIVLGSFLSHRLWLRTMPTIAQSAKISC